MNTVIQHVKNALLVIGFTAISILEAQALATNPTDSVTSERSFAVGVHLSKAMRINLTLAIYRPHQLKITIRNADNAVVYQEFLKKGTTSYWRKFNFEDSEPGQYQFEISDGQNTVVRRVDVVKVPAVEAQQYITYGPQVVQ